VNTLENVTVTTERKETFYLLSSSSIAILKMIVLVYIMPDAIFLD